MVLFPVRSAPADWQIGAPAVKNNIGTWRVVLSVVIPALNAERARCPDTLAALRTNPTAGRGAWWWMAAAPTEP